MSVPDAPAANRPRRPLIQKYLAALFIAVVWPQLPYFNTDGNQFLQTLFPDRVDPNSKKRPPTAGDRIKVYNYYPVFHVQLIDLYHPGVSWCPRREFDESSAILHSNDQTKSESQLVGV